MSIAAPENYDLSQAPYVDLLGVRIHSLGVSELVRGIRHTIKTGQKKLVTYVNVHGINLANDDARFMRFLNDTAHIVFCDGFGVKWGARLLGLNLPHRFTPPDWIPQLCELCVQHDLTLFFIGSRPGVTQKAATILIEKTARAFPHLPRLRIVGTEHGYFNKTPDHPENEAVVAKINAVKPDILMVGFGMPKQEYWLADNWPKLDIHVALTGGAVFDYISGEMQRPPKWMTDNGLEWLGRLIAEPKRMWRRYLIGNPQFLSRIIRKRLTS
jgi:N-acetylglucosaminyldiphosphoundecaprenol N-acetyl-beta-D-mannosaminyltransferase